MLRPGALPAGSRRLLRLLVLALFLVRDDVGPAQPACEIHIGAATRAEGAVLHVGGAAADGTLAAHDRRWIRLRHDTPLYGSALWARAAPRKRRRAGHETAGAPRRRSAGASSGSNWHL